MKLLIADDHTLFRDALVQYIRHAIDACTITVTKDFDSAFEILQSDHSYDLVILDFRMPGMGRMSGFEKIRQEFPKLKLALMSGTAESKDVKAAIDLGAYGYLPKTLSGKALLCAIVDILNGQVFIPTLKDGNEFLPTYYADEEFSDLAYRGKNHKNIHIADENFSLTPREKDVLAYLANGDSNKEIANAMGLQVVTIKLHIRGICRKLDANNRTQAALKATQLGLVETSVLQE